MRRGLSYVPQFRWGCQLAPGLHSVWSTHSRDTQEAMQTNQQTAQRSQQQQARCSLCNRAWWQIISCDMPLDSSKMRAFSWKPACNVVSGVKRIKLGAYVRFATLLFSVVRAKFSWFSEQRLTIIKHLLPFMLCKISHALSHFMFSTSLFCTYHLYFTDTDIETQEIIQIIGEHFVNE